MTITAIPTRTTGSLGPTKTDRRAVSDPYQQLCATEYNLLADCAIHAVTQGGIESSPAWDSLSGQAGGDTLRIYEPCIKDPSVTPPPGWESVTANPALSATLRGGWAFNLDVACDIRTSGFVFARGQKPYARFRFTTTGADPDDAIIVFMDTTANEGFGVEFTTAGTKLRGVARTGGVSTYTDVSTWTEDVECAVEMYVLANKLYVAKDGGTAVDCGAVSASSMQFLVNSSGGGSAGEHFIIRNILLLADWSA